MICQIYSAYNNKTQRYQHPVFRTDPPDQVAEVCREGYIMSEPEKRDVFMDYFHLGSFDNKTGQFLLLPVPVKVCSNSVFEAEIQAGAKENAL